MPYILYNEGNGTQVAITSSPTDPVPAGQVQEMFDQHTMDQVIDGDLVWDAATRGFVPTAMNNDDREVLLNQTRANLHASIATLRQWAADARATNVTQGNAVATLQTVVNRLGTFFDRFADDLETRL